MSPVRVPCPAGHALLAALAAAPIFLPVPVNFNIVATAAVTVYVGARRSVKPTPPQDSMTKKASGWHACLRCASPRCRALWLW